MKKLSSWPNTCEMKKRVGLLESQFFEGLSMKIRIPPKKICERFHLIHELRGAQKGSDVLARHYRVGRMKVVLNGRRVGNGFEASYSKNTAYFTKRGLNKHNILHEFYHHLVYRTDLEMSESMEESKANRFTRVIMESRRIA